MSHLIRTIVPGTPRPQGSLTIVTSRSSGKPFAKYSAAMVAHRNDFVGHLGRAWAGRDPVNGPVAVSLLFSFTRPKTHLGTGKNADQVKDSAPGLHIVAPDVDKLARLALDALTIAGVIRDDSLVTMVRAEKVYTLDPSSTVVELWSL